MKKKLTRKQALKVCYELWLWLAENPSKFKYDWPGWEKYGRMFNWCPCCEYADHCCKRCPLHSFWPNGFCTALYSSYANWRSATMDKQRRTFALKIANACKVRLKRYAHKQRKRK